MRAQRSAILVVVALAMGSAACAPAVGSSTPTRAEIGERHVVPNRLEQIVFEGFDGVASLDVDLHTAVETREAIDIDLKETLHDAGHRRWFFHAFDRLYLDFVVARYEPATRASSGGKYVAEHRLRVKRSVDAEKLLGVADCVRSVERAGAVRACAE